MKYGMMGLLLLGFCMLIWMQKQDRGGQPMTMDQWMKNQVEAQVAEERITSNTQSLDFSVFSEAMHQQTKEIDLTMSIAKLQAALDTGRFTSEELVIAYLKEIEKTQAYDQNAHDCEWNISIDSPRIRTAQLRPVILRHKC